MSSKPPKKVTFSDELAKYSEKDIHDLQKENLYLKQKIIEMQETLENQEKTSFQCKSSLLLIQDLSQKIQTFQSQDSENRKYIVQLQLENSQLSRSNDSLSQTIQNLNLKKQILESEVEKLSQQVYTQEIQLKKLSLCRNSNTINPNYKLNETFCKNLDKSDTKEIKPIPRRSSDTNFTKKPKRSPKPSAPKPTRNSPSPACKQSSRRFSHSSVEERQRSFERSANLEELKRLITQAKDHHLRYKSLC